MSKKILSLLLALLMLIPLFCACTPPTESGGISIVCTVFPCYDWTRQILGENPGNAGLRFLLDNGTDLHSFQPSVQDIVSIAGCDLFICVGGESEQWTKDALAESVNPDMVVIDLLSVLGSEAKTEQTVEGMQAETEEGEEEFDEHVWLSVRNASLFCEAITDALCGIAPENASVYRTNCKNYTDRLHALDGLYKDSVEQASCRTLLFADRFPFRYLVDDYGLSYYAAFAGCSSEINASFETVAFLAGKTDELSLGTVFVTEKNDRRIAEAVIHASKTKFACIRILDSMQSVTGTDAKAGTTYLSIMESNLETLKLALSEGV